MTLHININMMKFACVHFLGVKSEDRKESGMNPGFYLGLLDGWRYHHPTGERLNLRNED